MELEELSKREKRNIKETLNIVTPDVNASLYSGVHDIKVLL